MGKLRELAIHLRAWWVVPAVLYGLAAAMVVFPPWSSTLIQQLLNRLPEEYSEDQVVISSVFRHSVLLGLHAEAKAAIRKQAKTVTAIRDFQEAHLIARLKPGKSAMEAGREMRAITRNPRLRALTVRYVIVGQTHMLTFIWAAVLAGALVRAAIEIIRRPVWWRYRLYELFTLAGVGFVLVLLFGNVGEAMDSLEQEGERLPFLTGLLWGIFYVAATGCLVWLWRTDVRLRCRRCLEALRMPVELGEEGSMLLSTPRVERVCFQGHGALTMDRWHDDWRAYRDMWDAFSRDAHQGK
jgi:hypothetical protein